MSETITTTNPYQELYQSISKRSTEYAGLIGFSIATLRRIHSISTDEAVKLECGYAIEHITSELNNLLKP
jgi:hypothetical protein